MLKSENENKVICYQLELRKKNLLMFQLDGPVVTRTKVAENVNKCPLN